MFAYLYFPFLLTAGYLVWLLTTFVSNAISLRKVGFPVIPLPFLVQTSPVHMVFSPMLRLWLKHRLPSFLFNHLAFAIYGFEFHEKHTIKYLIGPRTHANSGPLGNGKTYAIATSGPLEITSWDPDFVREVSSRPKDFQQLDVANALLTQFGENVLTTDGKEWARHRRIVAGAVTERVSSVVWDESVRQTRDLLAHITSSGTSEVHGQVTSGTTYRMFDFIKRAAVNVLFAAGMGKTQDFPSHSISSQSEQIPPGFHLSYFDATRIINENMAGPILIPNAVLKNWPSFFPGAAWLHSLGHAKTDFPQYTLNNLAHEREIMSSASEPRNNVLSALIAASERNEGDSEKTSGRTTKGPALTDSEMVGDLFIFTVAGFDTTANTLSYALMLLARHPKWQSWLMEEIDTLLPEPTSTSPLPTYTYQTIFPQSQRALAIMLETLRFFPPLVHLAKQTRSPQPITLAQNTTVIIPARTTIHLNLIALHTDPTTWRNLNMTPLERKAAAEDEDNILQDEHIFRPSRWINPDGSMHKPAPGTYVPWSAGPRVCPGQKMAQVEFVGILTTLFSQHRLEAVRGTKKVKGGDEIVEIPESDDALSRRLDAVMDGSQPKLTLEMDVYNVTKDEPGGRGLGLSWIARK